MKEYLKDLLERQDKGIYEAQDMLAYLFRMILYDLDIRSNRWEVLISRMMADPRNPAPKNSRDRSSQKGNLNKAFRGNRMTFKTFIKGLKFLEARKLKIVAELTMANNKVHAYSVSQDLGGFAAEDFEDLDFTPSEEDDTKPITVTPMTERDVLSRMRAATQSTNRYNDSVEANMSALSKSLAKAGKLPRLRKRNDIDPRP